MSPQDLARLVRLRRDRADAARDALARVRQQRERAQATMAESRRALARHEESKPEVLNAHYTKMVGRPVTGGDWTAIEAASAALDAESARLAGLARTHEAEVHRLMGEEQRAAGAYAAARKALGAVEEIAAKVRGEHARAARLREEQELEEIAQERFSVARISQRTHKA